MNPSPHLNNDEGNASTRREPIRVADATAIGHALPRGLAADVRAGCARFWARRGMQDPGDDNDYSRAAARREAAADDTTPLPSPQG